MLQLGPGNGLAFTARPGAVPAAGTPVATSGATAGTGAGAGMEGPGFLAALLGALLGGLILNVMPCVFPILSLKALNLARAGETEAAARREALAYSGRGDRDLPRARRPAAAAARGRRRRSAGRSSCRTRR